MIFNIDECNENINNIKVVKQVKYLGIVSFLKHCLGTEADTMLKEIIMWHWELNNQIGKAGYQIPRLQKITVLNVKAKSIMLNVKIGFKNYTIQCQLKYLEHRSY